MLGRNNDLFNTGTSAEDQMKQTSIRIESQEVYESNLYKEATKRVVFSNCMGACNLDNTSVPNFNREFYYRNQAAQSCLQDCYNTRIKLHLGSSAEKEGLLLDFAAMKKEYQRYEKWNPTNRRIAQFAGTVNQDQMDHITQHLL